jgi:hypothetical protein
VCRASAVQMGRAKDKRDRIGLSARLCEEHL